jgi:hypothetical protein
LTQFRGFFRGPLKNELRIGDCGLQIYFFENSKFAIRNSKFPRGGFVKFIEKRIFQRVDAQIPVELKWEKGIAQSTSQNISCGGMFLTLDPSQFLSDQSIDVLVHLPQKESPVRLPGKVLRSEQSLRTGIAVQFEGLYNDDILQIEKFVKGKCH